MYNKRKNNAKWKRPEKVIRQDGQQVLVKHSSVYVRVHPCRLMLEPDGYNTINNRGSSTFTKFGTHASCPKVNGVLLVLETCIQMKVTQRS